MSKGSPIVSQTQKLLEDPRVQRALDKRPLEISLLSQNPSQEQAQKPIEKPSPRTTLAKLNRAWYDWMCLCERKEKSLGANLIFVPICMHNHYNLVVVNLLKESIQYLDDREYDEVHMNYYKNVASTMEEEMSKFLKRINHEKVEDILSYGFDDINNGEKFNADLDLANRSKVYRAKICAAFVLPDINRERDAILEKLSKFKVDKKVEEPKKSYEEIKLR
uniref:Ubiquitin-like protease family profile domain-containing protein n=1 Tax=Chenopodium quinoa TaxID=63459 RepID=A0A803KPV7_CHEQI